MTAKEKAKELFNKYLNPQFTSPIYGVVEEFEHAKEFALIAVVEIINSNPHSNPLNTEIHSTMQFWQEVKTEIKKL